MTLIGSLSLAMLCLSAQAQHQGISFTKDVIDLRRQNNFVLVTSLTLDDKWYGENPLGAANGRDLILFTSKKNPASAVKHFNDEEGWALIDPASEQIAEGRGRPNPSHIFEAMQKVGWVPYREKLKAYLLKNPEDGQAWLELAFDFARHARNAKNAGTLGANLRRTTREELVPCLQAIAKVPRIDEAWGDPGRTLFMSLFLAIAQTELDRDPEIATAIQPLAISLREFIAKDPELERLWYAHGLTLRATGWDGNPDSLIQFALSFEGVPGRPWPPSFFAFWMRSWYRPNPETMAREGREILDRNLEPELVRRLGKPHVQKSMQAWGGLHLEGLLLNGWVDEAVDYIGWLRTQSGSDWGLVAASLRGNLVPAGEDAKDQFDPMPMPALTSEQRSLLHRALGEAPPADKPLPRFVPMRFAMVGPHNPVHWGLLQNSGTFALWKPSELVWQPLKSDEIQAMKSRYAWNDGPRWVLMKGEDVLASADGQPTAEILSTVLRGHAIPKLETLNTFIKAHPDRLDARRERMEQVRTRLPNPRLEPFFIEDSEALAAPLRSLPFPPEVSLWRPSAKRVCARLTDKLRHWPFNTEDWLAYSDWAVLDQTVRSPASFLSSLDTWPCHSFAPLPGPIPAAASLAVMKSLLSSGRPTEADVWAQVLWERGLKDWMFSWAKLPPISANHKDGGRYDQQFFEVVELFALWGKALNRQGHEKRFVALCSELESIRPGLSKLLAGDRPT